MRVCIACVCASPARERAVAWQVSRLTMRGDPVPLFEALLLLLLPAGSKQRTPLLEQILVFLRSDACLLAQLALNFFPTFSSALELSSPVAGILVRRRSRNSALASSACRCELLLVPVPVGRVWSRRQAGFRHLL